MIDGLEGPHIELLTPEQVRGSITPRAADSHKGDFGRVLVIAGSRGKTGAAHLAAMGALRSGAGLVTVATPESCLPIVAAMAPEYMTEPLPETGEGSVAAAALDGVLDLTHDVVVVRTRAWAGPTMCAGSCRGSSIAPRCRWSSTPTPSPCSPTIPAAWSAGKSVT